MIDFHTVDPDGSGGTPIAMVESGAILVYPKERTWKFLSEVSRHHVTRAKRDAIPCGTERYGDEVKRLYAAMER